MNPFKALVNLFRDWKNRRELKKRIKEMRKRDPFIY